MSKRQANADASEALLRSVRGGAPVELCVQDDDQAARGLAAGRQRPVLVVMSYDPPPEGPSGIEVTSSATGATTMIGMFSRWDVRGFRARGGPAVLSALGRR